MAVLKALEAPKTPTLIASELHTSIANVSRAIRELRTGGFVELVTPKERMGKIYRATPRGRAVAQKVAEMQPSS